MWVLFPFNITGDNEETTVHDQSSEEQSIPSSQNLLSDQANRITLPSLREFESFLLYVRMIML